MATFRVLLRTDKQKDTGEAPVYLRITENRKSRLMKTEVAVEPDHWNVNTQRVRKSHPRYKKLNDELERLQHDALSATISIKASRARTLTAKAIKQELAGQGSGDFHAFAERYIDNLDAEGKFWEWTKVRVLQAKLKDFCPDTSLTFEEIDRDFLIRFEKYMREKRNNKTNTVQKNLQILQRMFRTSIRERL